MGDIVIEISEEYAEEMSQIKRYLRDYPNYKSVAACLGNYYPQNIVAGLIGVIVPESKAQSTILNKTEYYGNGTSGTYGWNCGEGLIQWTFWKYKLPLIEAYNEDSRSTQELPTNWYEYNIGEPTLIDKDLHSKLDGLHISGLSLENQIIFLDIYYKNLISTLKNETNLAVIVARLYQEKAGKGYYKNIDDPVERAYTTAENKYIMSDGTNHYLFSLKMAQEYINAPVDPVDKSEPVNDLEENDNIQNNESTNNNSISDESRQSVENISVENILNEGEEVIAKFDPNPEGDYQLLTSRGRRIITDKNGNVKSVNGQKVNGVILGTHMNQK